MDYRVREQNELKPSGVEWLGDIPKNWSLAKIKYLFNIGRGRVIAKTELNDKGIYPIYSSQTKNNGILGYINTYDFDCKQITWTTDGANAGTVFLREGKHNCTNVCGTLQKKKEDINYRYLFYILKKVTPSYKRPDTNGFKIMNGEMAEIKVTFPLTVEQQKIANFLDKKSKTFDDIISNKKLLIKKLEDAKQSLINEVVTGKLKVCELDGKLQTIKREKDELVDSKVEWIGDIPNDWQVKKLKYISQILSSNVDKKSYDNEEKVLLCNYVDVYKNEYITNKIDFMKATATESEIKKFSLRLGDIQITKDSESPDDIGIPAYVNEKLENVLCGYHLSILRNNQYEVYSKYLFRFFELVSVRNYFETMAKGVTRYALSLDAFKNLFVPVSDLKEQKQISIYLDEKCKTFDNTIEKTKQSIIKIKSAKESLISEAVTGKIEVL